MWGFRVNRLNLYGSWVGAVRDWSSGEGCVAPYKLA